MLLAGIAGREGINKTVSLICSILVSTGKKISVADSSGLSGLDLMRFKSYIRELEKNKTDILLLKLNDADLEKLLKSSFSLDILIVTGNSENPENYKNLKNPEENPEENPEVSPEKSEYAGRSGAFGISLLSGKLGKLLHEKGITIVNIDDADLISILDKKLGNVITYGFNSKASITMSSLGDAISDGSVLCCIQKSIPARNGYLVEPQEYKLKVEPGEFDTNNILAAASFAIVNGVDLNSLNLV